MKIVQHDVPSLKRPKFLVDGKLAAHLDENPLLANMNKHFCCAVMGRAGSGKSSLVASLLSTRGYMKRVWDTIYVFIPPNSRASMKDSVFDSLPASQIFDTLTRANLEVAYDGAEKNAKDKKQTLIVFDDVQQYFKQRDVEPFLLHMINNRRHARLSCFLIAQSYQKIPRQVRMACTDLFCFKLTKSNMQDIYDELVECEEPSYRQILAHYKHLVTATPDAHPFLYLHVNTQRWFADWNELIVSDPDESGAEPEAEPEEKKQRTA